MGLLYPQDSESRETKSLDGVWKFRISPITDPDVGFRERWFENGIEHQVADASEILMMPVPSSYNDIGVSSAVRDFLGWAWYEREFFVPQRWKSDNLEVKLRFGSVHYTAVGKGAAATVALTTFALHCYCCPQKKKRIRNNRDRERNETEIEKENRYRRTEKG